MHASKGLPKMRKSSVTILALKNLNSSLVRGRQSWSEVDNPKVDNPEVDNRELDNLKVGNPEVDNPEVDNPGVRPGVDVGCLCLWCSKCRQLNRQGQFRQFQ